MGQAGVEFVTETISGPIGAESVRRTSLNHEVLDNAMKGQTVVERLGRHGTRLKVDTGKAAFSESDKIGNSQRSLFVIKFASEFAVIRGENGKKSRFGRSCDSSVAESQKAEGN